MNFELDLFQRRIIDWNHGLADLLRQLGLPEALAAQVPSVLPLLELSLLAAVLGLLADRLDRAWSARVGGETSWASLAVQGAAALFALRVLYWLALHPSSDLSGLVARWDYLVMAVLGGLVLRRAPVPVRVWTLAGLSAGFVAQYMGRAQVEIILLVCLLGFAATRWRVTDRPGVRVVIQAGLMGGLLVWLWWLRGRSPLAALQGWGLYSFVVFRHASFVAEHAAGLPSSLGGYLCYLLFFPSCIGAMEVYNEFHERNLTSAPPAEFGRATVMVVRGNVLLWIALMVPIDADQVTASVGFASMWAKLMVLFLRAAVGTIGTWDIIEGGSLFLGFRLRPNFRDVLKATTPSQFWRAWRGTMTNWLIRYVYIPLGGNRRHQTVNILAAFFVSTVWHCFGVPFLRPAAWRPFDLAPIVLWGGLNFAGVAAHARVRRLRPASSPTPALLAGKWALTMVFGAMTVLLLGFTLGGMERFGYVVRTLVGLEGW